MDGGRYVVCVNRRVERKQELRDELCKRLGFWIEARLGDERLGGVSRRLIERFGADSRPADVLLRRASCGPGRLRSVELLREQLDHARAWQGDASAEIARWAGRAADELTCALAREEAEEALVRLESYG